MAGDSTVTPGNFSSQLLQRMGLPTDSAYTGVVDAWVHAESGSSTSGNPGWKYNNPLNASCYDWDTNKIGCWTSSSGHRFAIYPDLNAALGTYTGGGFLGSGSYSGISKAGSPLALANAITASPWDEGHYGSYKAGSLKGIAALAVQNGYVKGSQLGDPGATTVSYHPPSSSSSSSSGGGIDLNPLDAIGGIPKLVLNFFGGAIQNVFFDVMAMVLGLIFVTIGLIMFLKGTSSPTEAVRSAANQGIDLGMAAYAPELAAAKAGAMKRAPRPVPKESVSFATASGMRDSAPASQSPETPRAPLPVGYYHKRTQNVRVTVIRQEPKPLGSGLKLVGPGAGPAIPMPGAIELNPPKLKRQRKKAS